MAEIELREIDGHRTAFVAEWNMPVWIIMKAMEKSRGDVHQAARRLDLPVDAVRTALWYAGSHSKEIDGAVREQPGTGYQGIPMRRPSLTIADMLDPFEGPGIPLHPMAAYHSERK